VASCILTLLTARPHVRADHAGKCGVLVIAGTCCAQLFSYSNLSPSLKTRIKRGKMHHRTNQATGTHENAIQGAGMFPFAHPLFLTHPTSQYLPCPISCTGMREEAFPSCKRPHLRGQSWRTHIHRYVPFSFSYFLFTHSITESTPMWHE